MAFRQNRISAICAVLLSIFAVRAAPADQKPQLHAGSTFTVRFPQMPPTFYDLFENKDGTAQMTVYLPVNYRPDRKFPLLVFLNGWDGGPAENPGVARALCDGKDFVCLAVPLFKSPDFKVDKPSQPGERFIMDADDAKHMWPFFRTMLDTLEQTVPNIEANHRVLGGFSNGAHAAAGLIDESDGEISHRFSAFFFVEGGGRLRQYDLLKGKPFLMVSSNSKSAPRAREIADAAKAAGALTSLIVDDVGKHDFPVSAYPAVRDWLRKSAEVNNTAPPPTQKSN